MHSLDKVIVSNCWPVVLFDILCLPHKNVITISFIFCLGDQRFTLVILTSKPSLGCFPPNYPYSAETRSAPFFSCRWIPLFNLLLSVMKRSNLCILSICQIILSALIQNCDCAYCYQSGNSFTRNRIVSRLWTKYKLFHLSRPCQLNSLHEVAPRVSYPAFRQKWPTWVSKLVGM